jgi:hypothetical protein
MNVALGSSTTDAARLISLMRYVAKLLGNHSGAAGVAMALLEAHCSGNRSLTPQQIAAIALCSDDTVRRELNALLNAERVTRRYLGARRWSYRLEAKTALRITSEIQRVFHSDL